MFLNPEADLSLAIPVIAADILYLLHHHQKPIMVDELTNQFCRIDKRRNITHFYACLEFLYICGAIEHRAYRIHLITETMQPDLFMKEQDYDT